MPSVYFTICSGNYLAYAKTLAASLRAADPEARFVAFLADDIDVDALPHPVDFPCVLAKDIGIHDLTDMAFRYSIMEFNTAIKPFCIQYLWREMNASAAIYLDPDIYVLRPLEEVEKRLADGADIVLTPHLTSPLRDGNHPDEQDVMMSGVYNLGFGAFRNSDDTQTLIQWWADRLRFDCVVDLAAGFFVDQRLMDMAPGFVQHASILRHPGYNAAYWNLAHRTIARNGDEWHANDDPLVFFHFSGVVPGDHSVFSKHQNRFSPSGLGPLASLLTEYLTGLENAGHEDYIKIPYAYGTYNDGRKIPDIARRTVRRDFPKSTLPFRDPFAGGVGAYLGHPSREVPTFSSVTLNRIMVSVWRERTDLQEHFNIYTEDGQSQFLNWYRHSSEREYGLANELAETTDAPEAEAPKASLSMRAAQFALRHAGKARPLYRKLPKSVRWRVRNRLLHETFPAPDAGMHWSAPAPTQLEGYSGDRPNILVTGYFRSETGVGEGARRAVSALETTDLSVATYTVPNPQADHFKGWADRNPTPDSAPAIAITHMNADRMADLSRWADVTAFSGAYHIGYWAWELERLPEQWRSALDAVHEVWAPSAFVANAVRALTDKPVTVIPHPVPVESEQRDEGADRGKWGLSDDRVWVLSAFDANSFVGRKNPEAILTAIETLMERSPELNIGFVLKVHGQGNDPEALATLKARAQQLPHSVLIEDVLDAEDMRSLQNACDIFLSMHRSEGFGLHLAEMMALGKAVVATAYSGNLDFMTTDTAALIQFDKIAVVPGAYPLGDGQFWADPRIDHAVELLQELVEDDEKRRALGENARRHIREGFSLQNVGQLIHHRIDEIMANTPPSS